MFGRGKRERAELRAELKKLSERLDEMQREVSALRERPPEEKKDPDVMSEGERINKWIMGEKGDGF